MSFWVFIIAKPFKIQVSLFTLVTAALFAWDGQCDVKILCQTEALWGRLCFGWVILRHKLKKWPSLSIWHKLAQSCQTLPPCSSLEGDQVEDPSGVLTVS
jgi:hypothetical protein